MEPATTPTTPASTPITNIFKSTPKPVEVKALQEVPVVSCTNCEDSGKTCSVCGFDRE